VSALDANQSPIDDTPTQKNLNQNQRHDSIIELVINEGSVRIEDLADRFEVSVVTIHRDLDMLDARGIVRKSRGVVTAVATSLFEANPEYRKRQNIQHKKELAAEAFKLVEPGQAVLLDDSTTGVHLAELLPQRQPLSVITNFQQIIDTLAPHPGIALISLGGQHYQWSNAYMGSITVNALNSLRADTLFMSTPSIVDDVCFHQHHDASLIKEAMFKAAARRYLLVDESKFNQRALHANIALSNFDAVILNSGVSSEHVERLKEKDINVIVAAKLTD
jgi:DeoR/GlpR family transcriptional regulator of sugar metabolism